MTCSASVRVGFAVVALSVVSTAQVDPPLRASVVVGDSMSRFVKTLDMNGDGWEDAVGWWTVDTTWGESQSGYLRGWINDGTGKLVLAWTQPHHAHNSDPNTADACEVADLDHDGDDDFVTVSWYEPQSGPGVGQVGRIQVFLSNGATAPTLAISMQGGGGLQGVALADFDLDGDVDLAVTREHELSIYTIDLTAHALTSMSTVSTTPLNGKERLVAAELTGDTTPDLLVNGNRIYPVIGGQIQTPTVFPDEVDGWSKRHNAEDIDGDGDIDVLSFLVPNGSFGSDKLDPSYRVLRRTSATTFSREPLRLGGPARRLADLDGDGDLDGVCCGGGSGGSSLNVSNSYFRIALNDGTGSYANAISIPSMGSAAIAGVADLDHDGDQDLVAGRCVFYADGPITEEIAPVLAENAVRSNSIADVDADGDPDYDFQPVTLKRNRGDGLVTVDSFAYVPSPAGWNRTFGPPVNGDFDGDGDIDGIFKITRYWQPTDEFQRSLELVRNLGDGRFESAGLVSPIEPYTSLGNDVWSGEDAIVVDIGGDGDLDIAGSDSWWRNDGGSFVRQASFVGYYITWAGDLNGDSAVDLLAQGPVDPATGAHPMWWCAGAPPDAFGAWQKIHNSSVAMIDQVAVADFDADGDPDIVAIYRDFDSPIDAEDVFIHWNNGQGGFLRRLIYVGGFATDGVLSARAIDFDHDGILDVALGGKLHSPLAVTLLRHVWIDHAFVDPIEQVVFDGAAWHQTSMAIRDVDGDGDMDVLSQRSYLNRHFKGAEGGQRLQLDGGNPGLGSVTPILGATGPFRVGERVRLHLRGLRPGSRGVVAIGGSSSTTLSVSGSGPHPIRPETRAIPFHATGTAGDAPGSGWCAVEFVVPAALASSTRVYVAHVIDDAAPGGRARSNELVLTYGP